MLCYAVLCYAATCERGRRLLAASASCEGERVSARLQLCSMDHFNQSVVAAAVSEPRLRFPVWSRVLMLLHLSLLGTVRSQGAPNEISHNLYRVLLDRTVH